MTDSIWNNEKSREVYCPICKTYTEVKGEDPKCEKCNYTLYTVVKDIMTGNRITGSNE